MPHNEIPRRALIGGSAMGALALGARALSARGAPRVPAIIPAPSPTSPAPIGSRSPLPGSAVSAPTPRPPPRFTGVSAYLDPSGRFTFRYPTDWQRHDAADRDGVVIVPDTTDPATALSARANALGRSVHRADLRALAREEDADLEVLPEARVEARREVTYGNVLKLEREVSYRDGQTTRKRKTWSVYAGPWRIVLDWGGSTEDAYAYWLAMANYSFATLVLGPVLWPAFDEGAE